VISFLNNPNNVPFLVAYGFLIVLGLILAVGGLMDHGHDHDADVDGHPAIHGDVDGDGDVDFADSMLGFLGIGRVPLTMLLLTFCWAFGSTGFLTQWIAYKVTGALFPSLIASAIAIVPAIFLHGMVAKGIAKITDRDDSTAIHSDAFVGKTATIVIGQTTKGKPTQAKLKDQHGQTHYLMVEPHREEDSLQAGEEVVVVARRGSLFEVMPTDIDVIAAHLRAADAPKESV
jgi:hypothetical protein